MQINPYLNFDGNCAEAMRFYQKALGGKLEMMPFAGSPMEKDIPSQYRERIMHACLTATDGQLLMASDTGPWSPYEAPKGIQVTLNYDTAAEGKKAFDALSQGGQVTMPLQKTFWAEAFGMFTDRFGTPWMVNAGPIMVTSEQKNKETVDELR
jgi:PhnB protein